MTKLSKIDKSGSILPLILELEAELIEQDRASKKAARESVEKSRQAAVRRIGEAQDDLAAIETEEREKLNAMVGASLKERSGEEDKKFSALRRAIERNHQTAVDQILKKILP